MPMTRHKHAQTGLVTPQLPQQWLTAVLRAFAMLVQSVVSTFQMIRLNVTRDWHTPDDEAALPRVTNDTQSQETKPAAQHRSPIALILSSTQSVRPSKDEGVLTRASHRPAQPAHPNPLAPPSLRVRRFASNPRRKSGPRAPRVMRIESGLHQQPWIPACAGMSGFFCPPNKNAAA